MLASGLTTADGGVADYDGIAVGPALVYFPSDGSLLSCTKTGCSNSPSVLGGYADDLAADSTTLYGTDGDNIFACPLGNCTSAARVTLVDGLGDSDSIAVDKVNAYFSYDGAVGSCPLTGCASPTVLADHQVAPDDIATDGVNVYWTDTSDNMVRRCAIGGCGDSPTLIASGQSQPKGIALDDKAVYFTQLSGDAIVRVAK